MLGRKAHWACREELVGGESLKEKTRLMETTKDSDLDPAFVLFSIQMKIMINS